MSNTQRIYLFVERLGSINDIRLYMSGLQTTSSHRIPVDFRTRGLFIAHIPARQESARASALLHLVAVSSHDFQIAGDK